MPLDVFTGALPGVGAFALAFAMLGGLWLMLSGGRMIPKSHHDARIADKDLVIADKKEEIQLLRKALEVKDGQIDKLQISNEAWHRTMDAVERVAGMKAGGGGS